MLLEKIISAIDEFALNEGVSGLDWLETPENIVILTGEDICLFEHEDDNIYQVHFLFQSRGKAAVASARESFRDMFEDRNAELIFGLVPSDMRHAKMMARWVGGKFVGQRGRCDLFVLSKEMWSAPDGIS